MVKTILLPACLGLSMVLPAVLPSMGQDHGGKVFDYEGTLQQLRLAAGKGSAERPDTDRLDALYQIGYIYAIRFKSEKDKKATAYLDSSLRYMQLLIDQSRK